MDISCKQQRFLKHLAPLVAGLWLFVCVWCPLTHFKSHLRPDAASLAFAGSDSCAQCVLESAPVSLAPAITPLLPPAPCLPGVYSPPAVSSPRTLAPSLATRGPPTRLS
ncbi:hypothetical protein [Armatimonas rosea]|uniref:Uncharacterized protein n=1 Tax=Armatimonas rosea TaxID=685828 RepID=A0A7W9SP49_ARMRO|nr:hypothetical protein [Armatimonas rosea]MBB6050196.1 hypothetical protein [Armatimonas rosea]